MKVALMVVCWFSFQQAIFGFEGTLSECELKCPAGDGWLYPNMVLSGGTFFTIPKISTTALCQFLCAAIPDCEFFTYYKPSPPPTNLLYLKWETKDERDNTCELKNRDTGYMLSEQKDGAISGVKCIEGSPMQYGTDYAGADIGNIQVVDELECQQKCRDSADCYYWTFDKGNERCYFKKNYGWTIMEKEVAISGAGF